MVLTNPTQTVGDLVRLNPGRAQVFDKLNIDYCCGGKISLAKACEKRGIAVDAVLAQITAYDQSDQSTDVTDADAMTLSELADHIEATHHAYLREELPRLDFMTEKVARVHGAKEPRLLRVRDAFTKLKAELEPHMTKEEAVFFPMVRQIEKANGPVASPCGSIANPIGQLEHEHEQAGDALAVLRDATDDFTPPEWACNTYRAMLHSLAKLEADMHQHVHKENNVLFPKITKLALQTGFQP